MKIAKEGFELFDLTKLCDDKKNRDWGLILVHSKKYCTEDKRVLTPHKSKGFFPLSRLKKMKNKQKYRIIKNIDRGVVNNSCGVIVKLPRKLSINLCKIAGALCADGHISRSKKLNKCGYIIELDDKDKNAVEKFGGWTFGEFGYRVKIAKYESNAWSINFGNKIIGRFLHKILGLQIGEKSAKVTIPKIIKRAGKKYVRAFWLGVLTFDGGVDLSGAIELLVRSKPMIKSFSQFAKSEGLSITTHNSPDKNGFWRIHISKPSEKDLKKWIKLFEKDSRAWKRVYYMLGEFDGKTTTEETAVKSLYELYPAHNVSKTSIINVFYKIKELKRATNNEIAFSLGIDSDTLRKYRNLLNKANIIRVMEIKKVGSSGHKMIIEYNEDIQTWKIPRLILNG